MYYTVQNSISDYSATQYRLTWDIGSQPVTPGINTLLLTTGALGSFTCSGMTLPIYMEPTALRGIRATGDTLSNVESQVFTPYIFGSTAGDRTPDLLTTRPTCYHSATALCYSPRLCMDGCILLKETSYIAEKLQEL